MRIKSFIAALVIAALGNALVIPAAQAGEPSPAPATRHIDLNKAIAQAVQQSSPKTAASPANRATQPAMQRGYGGGGGGVMMAMSIVGILAGIGMTYYMVKQMEKSSKQAPTAPGQ